VRRSKYSDPGRQPRSRRLRGLRPFGAPEHL